jgi:hypothetical protein
LFNFSDLSILCLKFDFGAISSNLKFLETSHLEPRTKEFWPEFAFREKNALSLKWELMNDIGTSRLISVNDESLSRTRCTSRQIYSPNAAICSLSESDEKFHC